MVGIHQCECLVPIGACVGGMITLNPAPCTMQAGLLHTAPVQKEAMSRPKCCTMPVTILGHAEQKARGATPVGVPHVDVHRLPSHESCPSTTLPSHECCVSTTLPSRRRRSRCGCAFKRNSDVSESADKLSRRCVSSLRRRVGGHRDLDAQEPLDDGEG